MPGDILLIEEGESVCADARLVKGTLEVDMSTLTGESVPVIRCAGPADTGVPLLQAAEVIFSGTACTGGEAEALVTAIGMHTELGRIATLSQRAGPSDSPLEHQVKRATMLVVNTKGAPEEVLARVTRIRRGPRDVPITAADRAEAARVMTGYAGRGLRVLAVARRALPAGSAAPAQRQDAEQDLCLIGMAAMLDPLRPQVPAAIAKLHRAGIRVHVVTGDNGLTAAAIARRAGIGASEIKVVTGTELDAMTEPQLDDLLGSGAEVVFARSSPGHRYPARAGAQP